MRVRDYLNTDAHRGLIELLGLPNPLDDPERFVLATFQQDPRYTLADGEEPVVRWRLEGWLNGQKVLVFRPFSLRFL